MVLPASSPDDESSAREARWLQQLKLSLRLSQAGVLLHIDQARPERLGQLVRALLVDHPTLDVIVDAQAIPRLEMGSTVVYLPKAEHSAYLNEIRPVIVQRRLNIILFCDRETTIVLKNSAPDFLDWTSIYQECPEGPVPHAVAGLRAAVTAHALGIHWTGSDDDVAGVWKAISVAFPGETLQWIMPLREYEVTRDEIRSAGDNWVGCRTKAETHVRKFRWALAETGKRARAVLVTPVNAGLGFWPVHDRLLPLEEAGRILKAAGATHPLCLTAMVDLEPEAVELARTMVENGMKQADFVALLAGVDDPGATLAKRMHERGLVDETNALWPPTLRGLPERFPKDVGTFEKKAPDLPQLGAWIERRIRGGSDAQGWAEIAEQAVKLGDNDAAASWAVRSIELSGKILEPVRKIRADVTMGSGRDSSAVDRAFKDEKIAESNARGPWWWPLILIGMILLTNVAAHNADKFGLPDFKGAAFILSIVSVMISPSVVSVWVESRARRKLHIRLHSEAKTIDEQLSPSSPTPLDTPVELQEPALGYQDGRFKDAIIWLRKWQWAEREKYSAEHPQYRLAVRLLIRSEVDLGRHRDAKKNLEMAIVLEGRLVPVSQFSFIELMIELALLQQRHGDTKGAMVLLAKPLASGRIAETLGPMPNSPPAGLPFQDPEAVEYVRLYVSQPGPVEEVRLEIRARALRILAEAMISQGRYEEAEIVAEEAQIKNEQGQYVAALEAFRAMGIQGRACSLAGRYADEGKTLLQQAIALAEKTVGKVHIETARLMLDLTRMAHRHGDLAAIEWAQKAIFVYAQLKDDELRVEREEAFAELTQIAGSSAS